MAANHEDDARASVPPTGFDLHLVVGHYDTILRSSEGFSNVNKAIFFLGYSGSGKTTTMAYVCGCRLVDGVVEVKNGRRGASIKKIVQLVDGDPAAKDFVIGQTLDSTTKRFLAKDLPDHVDFSIVDSNGLGDTEGKSDFDVATAGVFFNLIQKAKEVSLVYVMSWSKVIADKAGGLREAASLISKILPGFPAGADSVLFLYTKVPPEEGVDGVLNKLDFAVEELDAKLQRKGELTSEENVVLTLARKCVEDLVAHPCTIVEPTLVTDSSGLRSLLASLPRISPQEVPCKFAPPLPEGTLDRLLVTLGEGTAVANDHCEYGDWAALRTTLAKIHTLCFHICPAPELLVRYKSCTNGICSRVRRLFDHASNLLLEKSYDKLANLLESLCQAEAVVAYIRDFADEYNERRGLLLENINRSFAAFASAISFALQTILSSDPSTLEAPTQLIDWEMIRASFEALLTMRTELTKRGSYLTSETLRCEGDAKAVMDVACNILYSWCEVFVKAGDYRGLVPYLQRVTEASQLLETHCPLCLVVWTRTCSLILNTMASDQNAVSSLAEALRGSCSESVSASTPYAMQALTAECALGRLSSVASCRSDYRTLLPGALEVLAAAKFAIKSALDNLLSSGKAYVESGNFAGLSEIEKRLESVLRVDKEAAGSLEVTEALFDLQGSIRCRLVEACSTFSDFLTNPGLRSGRLLLSSASPSYPIPNPTSFSSSSGSSFEKVVSDLAAHLADLERVAGFGPLFPPEYDPARERSDLVALVIAAARGLCEDFVEQFQLRNAGEVLKIAGVLLRLSPLVKQVPSLQEQFGSIDSCLCASAQRFEAEERHIIFAARGNGGAEGGVRRLGALGGGGLAFVKRVRGGRAPPAQVPPLQENQLAGQDDVVPDLKIRDQTISALVSSDMVVQVCHLISQFNVPEGVFSVSSMAKLVTQHREEALRRGHTAITDITQLIEADLNASTKVAEWLKSRYTRAAASGDSGAGVGGGHENDFESSTHGVPKWESLRTLLEDLSAKYLLLDEVPNNGLTESVEELGGRLVAALSSAGNRLGMCAQEALASPFQPSARLMDDLLASLKTLSYLDTYQEDSSYTPIRDMWGQLSAAFQLRQVNVVGAVKGHLTRREYEKAVHLLLQQRGVTSPDGTAVWHESMNTFTDFVGDLISTAERVHSSTLLEAIALLTGVTEALSGLEPARHLVDLRSLDKAKTCVQDLVMSALNDTETTLLALIRKESFQAVATRWRSEVELVERVAKGSPCAQAADFVFAKVRSALAAKGQALFDGELTACIRSERKKPNLERVVAVMAQLAAAAGEASKASETLDFAALHQKMTVSLQSTVDDLFLDCEEKLTSDGFHFDESLLARLVLIASRDIEYMSIDSTALKNLQARVHAIRVNGLRPGSPALLENLTLLSQTDAVACQEALDRLFAELKGLVDAFRKSELTVLVGGGVGAAMPYVAHVSPQAATRMHTSLGKILQYRSLCSGVFIARTDFKDLPDLVRHEVVESLENQFRVAESLMVKDISTACALISNTLLPFLTCSLLSNGNMPEDVVEPLAALRISAEQAVTNAANAQSHFEHQFQTMVTHWSFLPLSANYEELDAFLRSLKSGRGAAVSSTDDHSYATAVSILVTTFASEVRDGALSADSLEPARNGTGASGSFGGAVSGSGGGCSNFELFARGLEASKALLKFSFHGELLAAAREADSVGLTRLADFERAKAAAGVAHVRHQDFAPVQAIMMELVELSTAVAKALPKRASATQPLIDNIKTDVERRVNEFKARGKDAKTTENLATILIELGGVTHHLSNSEVTIAVNRGISALFNSDRSIKYSALFNELSARAPHIADMMESFPQFQGQRIKAMKAAGQGIDIDVALEKLQRMNPDATVENLAALRAVFAIFKRRWDEVIHEFFVRRRPAAELKDRAVRRGTQVSSLDVAHQSESLATLLAEVFGYFSITKSAEHYVESAKNTASGEGDLEVILELHPCQALACFIFLGLHEPVRKTYWQGPSRYVSYYQGSNKDKLFGLVPRLIQVGTGQGKSIVLGGLCSILALIGMNVDCACYNEVLSARDEDDFAKVFEALGIRDHVRYGSLRTLAEHYINDGNDLREQCKEFLVAPTPARRRGAGSGKAHRGSNPASSYRTGVRKRPRVLLLDEADVFFSADFYGATYEPTSYLYTPEVFELQRHIWQAQRSTLAQVTSLPAFATLTTAFPHLEAMFRAHIAEMIERVSHHNDVPYVIDIAKVAGEPNVLGYEIDGGLSTTVRWGYDSVFAHHHAFDAGLITDETLRANSGIIVPCGSFSFAEIPKGYDLIMGVSGTLPDRGSPEDFIVKGYGIVERTTMPSMFPTSSGAGDSALPNLSFDIAASVQVLENIRDQSVAVKEAILSRHRSRRPVIVIFDNAKAIKEFLSTPAGLHLIEVLRGKPNVMVPGIDNPSWWITKATVAGTVTLITRDFGRGSDFKCRDEAINDAGGVHVIQTVMAMSTAEELQFMGRAARMGKKGSYEMIFAKEDLAFLGIGMDEAGGVSGGVAGPSGTGAPAAPAAPVAPGGAASGTASAGTSTSSAPGLSSNARAAAATPAAASPFRLTATAPSAAASPGATVSSAGASPAVTCAPTGSAPSASGASAGPVQGGSKTLREAQRSGLYDYLQYHLRQFMNKACADLEIQVADARSAHKQSLCCRDALLKDYRNDADIADIESVLCRPPNKDPASSREPQYVVFLVDATSSDAGLWQEAGRGIPEAVRRASARVGSQHLVVKVVTYRDYGDYSASGVGPEESRYVSDPSDLVEFVAGVQPGSANGTRPAATAIEFGLQALAREGGIARILLIGGSPARNCLRGEPLASCPDGGGAPAGLAEELERLRMAGTIVDTFCTRPTDTATMACFQQIASGTGGVAHPLAAGDYVEAISARLINTLTAARQRQEQRRSQSISLPQTTTFVIDVSGSMEGARIAAVIAGMEVIFNDVLTNVDRMTVITFDDAPTIVIDRALKTDLTWPAVSTAIMSRVVGGGTQMYRAIAKCLVALKAELRASPDTLPGEVVVLTDGESGQNGYDEVMRRLRVVDSLPFRHMIVMGVGVSPATEATLCGLCSKCPASSTYFKVTEDPSAIISAFERAKVEQVARRRSPQNTGRTKPRA